MSQTRSLFATWRHALAFWCGSVMVSIGVFLHVPMLWMGRNNLDGDAFSNPEHVAFALKGCLAATMCYSGAHFSLGQPATLRERTGV